ncbi:MAG: hypothetical protein M1830_004896, partial [Pleopsidium flavum]
HIGTVLCAILRTASAIGISSTHRAAACNALCGFLEHGLVSTTLELRSLIISNDVWQEAFTIYLNRSEDAKPKSMRQVLVTLTAILSKWPNPGQALVVRNRAVNTLLSIILGTDSRSKVKPALQALEHFTSKGVVPILDVVVSLQGLGNRNPGQLLSGSVLPQCAEAGTVAVVEFDDTHLSEPPLLASSEASIEFFVITLLEWVSHSDVAPAASRFISTFFKVLRKQDSKDVRYYHSVTKLPLWVSPLKRSVEQRLEGLEFLKHHVLPALFILDSHDMLQFVRSLPLEHLLSGTFPNADWPEVLLLFSSLQVAQGLGLVRVIEQGIRENDSDDKSNIHVPLTACAQLLTHSSATIRVATLALLVTSTSTTKPFSPPVLSLIMENLTQFHADTDTGVRDHVIGITRCVVHRLRGAISQLNKALERQNNHASGHDSVKYLKQDCNAQQPDSVPSSQHSMEQHLAFLKWYIDFLGSELRPTASYQRHITALKALAILLQSGLDSTVPQAYLSKLAQEDFKWPLTIPIVQPLLIRMLFDLSMDPYDDVRCAAVLVLKMTASAMGIGLHRRIVSCLPSSAMVSVTHSSSSQRSSEGGSQNQEETSVLNLAAILSRAQKIMHSTGRADHADGVARLYEILDEICAARTTIARQGEILADVWWYSESSIVNRILSDLEKGLLLAKTNLRLAVADAPIHGDLSALRYGNCQLLVLSHYLGRRAKS